MDRLINWNIISNPANWIIIFLVLYFLALLAKVVYDASASSPIALPQGL